MLEQMHRMAVFKAVIDAGSFRGAAKKLGLSPSVVSHHVSQLEDHLGFALLYRTTRRISLTDAGAELLESARRMTEAAEAGLGAMSRRREQPEGRLRITMPSGSVHPLFQEFHVAMVTQFPKLHLTLHFGDNLVDLEGSEYDLAIRGGFRGLADSPYKARRVYRDEVWMVASAGYVAERGMPQTLDDLAGWDWIESPEGVTPKVVLADPPDRLPDMPVRVTMDSVIMGATFCEAGFGIFPTVRGDLIGPVSEGRLVRLLPDLALNPVELYAVWPANVGPDSPVHLVVDYIATHLQSFADRVAGLTELPSR